MCVEGQFAFFVRNLVFARVCLFGFLTAVSLSLSLLTCVHVFKYIYVFLFFILMYLLRAC